MRHGRLIGLVAATVIAGMIAAADARAQVRGLSSGDGAIGGRGGAAASLIPHSGRYDSYDVVPTLRDRDRRRGPGGGGSSDRNDPGGRDAGNRSQPDDRGIRRHRGSMTERFASRREARAERRRRAAERAKKLRKGFPGVIAPFVVRDYDDDDPDVVIEIIDDTPPEAPIDPEAAPLEFSPAEPLRLRAGQREPDTVAEIAAALTVTVSARGGTFESVASEIDTKRLRILRAIALADASACIDGQGALDIASDADTGFRGEGQVALRVADASTVLGVMAALPEDTVAGVSTAPDHAGVATATAEAGETPTRGFKRVPGRRIASAAGAPAHCLSVE
ncbi:MAG: hypothetical protein AAF577_09095 [Pseudomonadota bacterium]